MGPLTKSTRLLLLALGLVLGLMSFVYYLSNTTARETSWLLMNGDLRFHLQEAILDVELLHHAPDQEHYFVHLHNHIEDSRQDVVTLLNGGVDDGNHVVAVDDANIRRALLALAVKIQSWSVLAQQLQHEPTDRNLQRLSEETSAVADAANTINRDLTEQIKKRRLLEQAAVMSGIASIAIILLATFAVVRRAGRLIVAKSREVSSVLRTLDAQKYALDQHSIVAMTDVSGRITEVNEKFCEISGYSREELLGQNHRILNSGYHPPEFFIEMWRTISNGRTWHGEIHNRAKNGTLYWVDTTIVPYLNEAGEPVEFVAIRTDITRRKRYETELKATETRLKRQNRALQQLAKNDAGASSSLNEMVQSYTEEIATAIDVQRVGVWVYNDDRTQLDSVDLFDVQKQTHREFGTIVVADNRPFFLALEQRHLVSVSDLKNEPQLRPESSAGHSFSDVGSLIAVSIRGGGRVMGYLIIEQMKSPRDWRLDEENFVASVGDLISALLEVVSRNRVEHALQMIAQAAPESGGIFEELVYQIAKGVAANIVVIGHLNADQNKVSTLAFWNESEIGINFSYTITAPLEHQVVVRELTEEDEFPNVELQRRAGIHFKPRSYLSVPIINRKNCVIGVLLLVSRSVVPNIELASSMLRLCATRAAAELERSEAAERLKTIVESMSDFIWEADAKGTISYCSERIKGILGFSSEEVVGRNISEFLVERSDDISGQEFIQMVRSGQVIRNFELWVKTKNKNNVCLLCNAAPIYDEERGISGYRGINSDITQRKESEMHTRLLATAIDQSVDGVLIADVYGYVEYANPAYLHIVGRTAEAVVGAHIRENGIIAIDDEFRALFLEKFHNGTPWVSRCVNHKQHGKNFDEEVMITPIYNESNQLFKVVVGVRDISQEVLLEQQSRQSQKMQAIGTMAGGIAHDFNNILSAILGYADLTLEDLPQGSASYDNLSQVVQAAGRAKNLVQQILAFSRQSASSLQLLSPRTMTKEVMKLLRSTIPSVIKIHEEFKVSELFVRMDPTQYHQVVMNLLVNASHAIGKQPGNITVILDDIKIEEEGGTVSPGHYVRLVVEDSGCGMSQEVQERIFEPFFTTKAVDEGTGMGLAAVHGIISAIHGYITVSSVVGKGSRFEVYMPVANGAPEQVGPTVDIRRRGDERILIIDDEEVQTALMKQMLERLGYRVVICNDSSEALMLFSDNPNHFDAVITDMNMPGINGEQLSSKMLHIRPDIPILMCSGYSQGFGPDQAALAGIRGYIMKPVTLNDMDQALARVFASQPGSEMGAS